MKYNLNSKKVQAVPHCSIHSNSYLFLFSCWFSCTYCRVSLQSSRLFFFSRSSAFFSAFIFKILSETVCTIKSIRIIQFPVVFFLFCYTLFSIKKTTQKGDKKTFITYLHSYRLSIFMHVLHSYTNIYVCILYLFIFL